MTKYDLINTVTERLTAAGFECARFEATWLVECGIADGEDKVLELLERRIKREPLQYILGEWEFYGLPFKVGEGVLIPRADTETLVETALKIIKDENLQKPTVFDLCAGSGCIGITLAHLTDADVKMFEKSPKAVNYLSTNVELNKVTAEVYEYDVLGEPFSNKFADMIISNPPYIRTEVINTLEAEVQCEPRMALDGGENGLLFYRHIADRWKSALKDGGWLLFEIGFDQATEVTEIMQNYGYSEIRVIKDLSGNDRVVVGKLKVKL